MAITLNTKHHFYPCLKGAVSDSLLCRLSALEKEKATLAERIKFLRSIDKSSIYMLPSTIKNRFSQIPDLLQQSDPFDVHRAIKPLLAGAGWTTAVFSNVGFRFYYEAAELIDATYAESQGIMMFSMTQHLSEQVPQHAKVRVDFKKITLGADEFWLTSASRGAS